MGEEDLNDLLIDGCNRATSIEIRKHVYFDGEKERTEYVAIARLGRGGMSRKTADTLEEAVRKCVADID